jgi:hypothetical protein
MKLKSIFGPNVIYMVTAASAASVSLALLFVNAPMVNAQNESWTSSFNLKDCHFSTIGINPYLILQPGYQLAFAGIEDNEPLNTTVTVLNETKAAGDGIVTRVVEERVTNGQTGDLKEITKDYLAICNQTNSVFYFGEDVDKYENGRLVDHEGSWLHGSDNARAGLIMPGTILLGSRYYQEMAPGKAMDKSEIVGMNQTVNVPAGNFSGVIKMKETNDLEPGVEEDNLHAPGVGQIIDNKLELVRYGYLK